MLLKHNLSIEPGTWDDFLKEILKDKGGKLMDYWMNSLLNRDSKSQKLPKQSHVFDFSVIDFYL